MNNEGRSKELIQGLPSLAALTETFENRPSTHPLFLGLQRFRVPLVIQIILGDVSRRKKRIFENFFSVAWPSASLAPSWEGLRRTNLST